MDRAIVILGAAMDEHGQPGPALLRRVARGAALAREHPEMPIIVSGGALHSARSEADLMRVLLVQDGILANRILCEDQSLNTLQNVLNTRAFMAAHGIGSIQLVSDSFHLPRALMTCWWLGVTARGVPVWNPQSEIVSWLWAHLREGAAIPVYVIRLCRHSLKARRR